MCKCSTSNCGCLTVSGIRGPRGDAGPPGANGANAQMLTNDGPPSSPPPDPTAYAWEADLSPGGHYWLWTPGSPGSWADSGASVTGADGADGKNAFTVTTAPFTMPVATGNGSTVVNFIDTTWMVDNTLTQFGQTVFIEGAGYFRLAGIISATQAILINRRNDSAGTYQENADPGVVIAAGAHTSPGGIQGPAGVPVEFSTGAPDPTVAPAGGASGWYTQTGVGGTYWYYNGTGGGPWTDTGQSVTGPAGPAGAAGAAGYSPVTTTGTGAPSGGNNGDIYFRQINPGLLQVYTKAAGVWTAGITILSNRLLGYSNSNPTPNPSSLPANSGDQWWTQIGSIVTMWVYNGTFWAVALTFSTGGGGGGGDLPTTIAATTGQLSGPLAVNWQRTNFEVVHATVVSAPAQVVTLDTNYSYHEVTVNQTPFTLNYTDPPAGYYGHWTVALYNNTSGQVAIQYAANQWKKGAGITHPVLLNASETAILHLTFYKSYMIMTAVDLNMTII